MCTEVNGNIKATDVSVCSFTVNVEANEAREKNEVKENVHVQLWSFCGVTAVTPVQRSVWVRSQCQEWQKFQDGKGYTLTMMFVFV